MKIVVTGGAKGADIDVLACVVAYAELLSLEGKSAVPVVAGSFTASVTKSILDWAPKYETDHMPEASDNFVLVDISDPQHVPHFVDLEQVTEVYDHREGHVEYWNEKIDDGAHIEMVGACGTLIWDEFKKRLCAARISKTSSKLLLVSIVSNTLNFNSPGTTDKDVNAYRELSELAGLDEKWISDYFKEQEELLLNDFEAYFTPDIKTFSFGSETFVIAQLELWDAEMVLKKKKGQMLHIMKKFEPLPWIVNCINISKGFNYIYSESESGKELIVDSLNLKFEENIAKTEKLTMRKYIMKKIVT